VKRRRVLAALSVAATLLSGAATGQTPDPPFKGETLRYAMSWKIFAGGIMTITASDEIVFEGRPAYKIELSAISNEFISNFFVVRDSITSWIDKATLQSLRYEKHSVEGKRVDDERIDFDLEEKIATREGRKIRFQPPVFDSLSAVYYLRTRTFQPGEPVELEVVSGKHAYRLEVDVLGMETVKTPAGTFVAQKVHPKMKKEEGLLKKGGDLWIWFASDARRTPVMIRSKLNFGTLTARLVSGISGARPPE